MIDKEKKREYDKKYSAKYRADKKEQVAKYASEYYEKNKERIKTLQKENAKKNKEKIRIRKAITQQKNKEKIALRLKKYRQTTIGIEAGIRANNNRRARKNYNGGTLSVGIINKLNILQKGKCIYCKNTLAKTGKHLDHIIPLALGGKNEDKNVQLLCPTCNLSKSAKHPIHFANLNGLLL